MKIEYTAEEANVSLNMMKRGLANILRNDFATADGAIDTYVYLKGKIQQADLAERRAVHAPPKLSRRPKLTA